MLLTPLQTRKLISYCMDEHCALLAVNIDSASGILDCIRAAKQMDSPIIIETSLWQLEGISFGAGDPLRGIALYIAHINLLANSEEFRDIPVVYHIDHIRGPDTEDILTGAVKGIPFKVEGETLLLSPSSISLDASGLSVNENVELMCSLIETSKKYRRPVTLEMEAGIDGGYTAPEEVEALVMGVEKKHPGYLALFAPGLGSRHGYSEEGYPDFQPENVAKNTALIEKLTGRKIGVVLHGSSGLSEDQIKRAVSQGLIKMNWSTAGLILRSSAAQEYYKTHHEKLVPGHPDFKQTAGDNGVGRYVSVRFQPAVKRLIKLLKSDGKAGSFMAKL
jgi:fructose/tagatose bisphosphate aldolase